MCSSGRSSSSVQPLAHVACAVSQALNHVRSLGYLYLADEVGASGEASLPLHRGPSLFHPHV